MNYTQGEMPLLARAWNGLVFGLADMASLAWGFRFSILVTLLLLWAILGHGMGTRIPDFPAPATSNAPSVPVEPDPAIVGNGSTPDSVAAGTFARPAIGISGGTVTVAAEGAGMASIWVYRLTGGKWVGGKAVTGSASTADRVYVPDVAGGVVSFRYGPKTGGTWKGPGLVLPDGRVIRTQLTTGAARLAQDDRGVVLMSKDAAWGRVNPDGSIGQRGRFAGLSTGEKLALACSGSSWAVGMNGYSKQDASVAVGTATGGKVTAVAAYATYPAMSSDLLYCSVAITSNGVWFASGYNGRLRINSVTGGKARWPITALADLGPCVTGDRCPPRLVTVQGRPVAIYEAPGRAIMRQAVPDGKPVRVATGSQPAATVDGAGRIHVVWVDGGLRYRVLD